MTHSVKIKLGIHSALLGKDISGWQGRIVGIEIDKAKLKRKYNVEWDSKTLKNLPHAFIKDCHTKEVSWSDLWISEDEVESARPRDKKKKVIKVRGELQKLMDTKNLEPSSIRPFSGSFPRKGSSLSKSSGEKVLMRTLTDENFQPARLNYRLKSKTELLKVFSNLRCIDRDDENNRWVWLFDYEAKRIKLLKSYSQIPRELRPIVIGAFFIHKSDRLVLNLNSFSRVIESIKFFEKYIPRAIAEVTNIEIVNKLFDKSEFHMNLHSEYFEIKNSRSIAVNPDTIINQAKMISNSLDDPMKRLSVLLKASERSSKEPLPEVEQIPPNFYEDGIESLEGVLKFREIIAMKHWSGEKDFSFDDLLQQIIPKMSDLN